MDKFFRVLAILAAMFCALPAEAQLKADRMSPVRTSPGDGIDIPFRLEVGMGKRLADRRVGDTTTTVGVAMGLPVLPLEDVVVSVSGTGEFAGQWGEADAERWRHLSLRAGIENIPVWKWWVLRLSVGYAQAGSKGGATEHGVEFAPEAGVVILPLGDKAGKPLGAFTLVAKLPTTWYGGRNAQASAVGAIELVWF